MKPLEHLAFFCLLKDADACVLLKGNYILESLDAFFSDRGMAAVTPLGTRLLQGAPHLGHCPRRVVLPHEPCQSHSVHLASTVFHLSFPSPVCCDHDFPSGR